MEVKARVEAIMDWNFVLRVTLLTGFGLGLYVGTVATVLAYAIF